MASSDFTGIAGLGWQAPNIACKSRDMASSSKVLAFKKDWNSYCALSLVHFMAYPECSGGDGPILETVARIADDDFFSAIELSRINDDTVQSQTARLIDQSHMQVAFGAQPIILGSKLNLNAS